MRVRDLVAERCGPDGRPRRSARRSSPSRARAARRRPSGRRPRRRAPRCRRSWRRAAGPCGRGCRGRRRSSRGRRPSPGRRSGAPAPACRARPTAGPACRRRAGRARTRAPSGEFGLGGERRVDPRQRRGVRHPPRLRAVGQRAVGQQQHRRPVGHRDPRRLQRGVEAVGGRARGDDRQRRLAVAAEHRLQQVGLLGLGGQPGRRAAALHVDDQQRQLQRDGQADRLAT